MEKTDLPSFERPPVVETVLGVMFDPIPRLTNAHLGLFWCELGPEEWPKVRDAASLDPEYEEFGPGFSWGSFAKLTLTRDPACRIQFIDQAEDRLIQVQNSRFHYNWLFRTGEPYPRYKKIRPEFDRHWTRFLKFLESRKLPKPTLRQWEVTYVNHFPKGTVWNRPEDWSKLFTGLPGAWSSSSLNMESFGGEWRFEIPPQRGRVHVKIGHGKRDQPESTELIRVDLTARGPIAADGKDHDALGDGLDIGRESIVRLFADITSEEAHRYWGRTDE